MASVPPFLLPYEIPLLQAFRQQQVAIRPGFADATYSALAGLTSVKNELTAKISDRLEVPGPPLSMTGKCIQQRTFMMHLKKVTTASSKPSCEKENKNGY